VQITSVTRRVSKNLFIAALPVILLLKDNYKAWMGWNYDGAFIN
jgi:hypothetical protein